MGMDFQNTLLVWLGPAADMDFPPLHEYFRGRKGEKQTMINRGRKNTIVPPVMNLPTKAQLLVQLINSADSISTPHQYCPKH